MDVYCLCVITRLQRMNKPTVTTKKNKKKRKHKNDLWLITDIAPCEGKGNMKNNLDKTVGIFQCR